MLQRSLGAQDDVMHPSLRGCGLSLPTMELALRSSAMAAAKTMPRKVPSQSLLVNPAWLHPSDAAIITQSFLSLSTHIILSHAAPLLAAVPQSHTAATPPKERTHYHTLRVIRPIPCTFTLGQVHARTPCLGLIVGFVRCLLASLGPTQNYRGPCHSSGTGRPES
jgi:hypothetical protein